METTRKKAVAALAGTLAAGGVAGALLFTPVAGSAQDAPTTTTTAEATADSSDGPRQDAREAHRAEREADQAALAEVLGITPEELRQAREDGQTLAEIAEDGGVDRQAVIDHIVAAQTERLEERIAELPDHVAALVDGEAPEGGPGGFDGPGHRHGPPDGGDVPPDDGGATTTTEG